MLLDLIICTHNPNLDFLQRTVDGLKKQTLPLSQWGFLIVDNSSKSPVSSSFVDWHPNGKLIVESELGLTPARICGIRNTNSELLVFVDDDNVLSPDYVENVFAIIANNPSLGAYGAGQIIPEFAVEPDADCRPFVKSLALRKRSSALWSNNPEDVTNPWGAGLVVRRAVANEFVEVMSDDPLRKRLGRKGNSLNSAEDIEFSWIACRQGFSKGVFPELQMRHLIDQRRVDRGYLARLCEGHAFSHVLMRYLHHQESFNLADQLNAKEGDKNWTTPRRSMREKVKYWIAWFLAKSPVLSKRFANVVRLSSYNGRLRAYRLIEDIERQK